MVKMDMRRTKAEQIAKACQIVKNDKGKWLIPSQSGRGMYAITQIDGDFECTCKDYELNGKLCKHIMALQITLQEGFDKNKLQTANVKRTTYSQDWPNYDKAQTQEKELFMKLLHDLVQNVGEVPKEVRRGRPKLSARDMAFASALKVFTTFSLRRFVTDAKNAQELGYMERIPHYSSVALYMENPSLTPILNELIALSAQPLKSVESKFAIDSTGFRTTKFNDYCREKHNTREEHQWIKAHICCGTNTHIITGVEVGDENSADNNQFIPLSQRAYERGFLISEMTADKAYSSRDNYGYIDSIGGTAFIPYRSNATGKPRGKSHIWKKMFGYFIYNREEFMEHYHQRSNIESTNNMIKAKFTDLVRSRNGAAQTN